jgi:hypothetical protein
MWPFSKPTPAPTPERIAPRTVEVEVQRYDDTTVAHRAYPGGSMFVRAAHGGYSVLSSHDDWEGDIVVAHYAPNTVRAFQMTLEDRAP